MPMTPWSEMIGKHCQMCGGPATHYYGNMIICCCCHVGVPEGGILTRAMAEKVHRGEDPFPVESLDTATREALEAVKPPW